MVGLVSFTFIYLLISSNQLRGKGVYSALWFQSIVSQKRNVGQITRLVGKGDNMKLLFRKSIIRKVSLTVFPSENTESGRGFWLLFISFQRVREVPHNTT